MGEGEGEGVGGGGGGVGGFVLNNSFGREVRQRCTTTAVNAQAELGNGQYQFEFFW